MINRKSNPKRRYHFLVYLCGNPDGLPVAAEANTEQEARERIKAFYGDFDDILLMKVEKL